MAEQECDETTPRLPPAFPGYLTTEFWLTLSGLIVSALAFFKLISQGSHDTMVSVLGHSLEAVAIFGAQGVVVHKYVKTRKELKENEQRAALLDAQNKAKEEQDARIKQQVDEAVKLLMTKPPAWECDTCKTNSHPARKTRGRKNNDS